MSKSKKNKNSITGQYLSGKKSIELRKKRKIDNDKKITIKGASGNNLKKINAEFPLGRFICVTGVSGSGKSTLLFQTLYRAMNRTLNNSQNSPMKYDSIDGMHLIDKIININQSPIGRTKIKSCYLYWCVLTHEVGFVVYLNQRQEDINLGAFHSMLRAEDVKLVRVMV